MHWISRTCKYHYLLKLLVFCHSENAFFYFIKLSTNKDVCLFILFVIPRSRMRFPARHKLSINVIDIPFGTVQCAFKNLHKHKATWTLALAVSSSVFTSGWNRMDPIHSHKYKFDLNQWIWMDVGSGRASDIMKIARMSFRRYLFTSLSCFIQ